MKKREKKQPENSTENPLLTESQKEMEELLSLVHIPPGMALNDIFLDQQDMATQLNSSKKLLSNMRKNGELSYTHFNEKGKVYYFKQEVAGILRKNIVIGKKSPLRKTGLQCISTLISVFSLCPADAAEIVNTLMFA